MTQPTLSINGIDVQRSKAVQDSIRADGDGAIARPQYRAVIDWQSGYETVATVGGGQSVRGDEPVAYGGKAHGLSPQDLLLTAVGNCVAATFVGGLSSKGIEVYSLRISVAGRVDFRVAYGIAAGAPGFEAIEVAVDIATSGEREQVERLLRQLYPTAPIPDTILRPVPVQLSLEIQ
jgi:uncharacterized OsmC-like protein